MADNNQAMKDLADALWVYFEEKVLALMQKGVTFYRARVVSAPAEGRIIVQKPMESTQLSLPYVPSAATLEAGGQATVLEFGSPSNAIVVGDGMLQNL